MKKEQRQVKELMEAMGQSCPVGPVMPEPEVRRLRVKLIAEELCEYCKALNINLKIISEVDKEADVINVTGGFGVGDEIEAYDALIDLLYVTVGSGVASGVDLQAGWDEVNRSNASKIPDNIGREFGTKWIKGPNYVAPNLGPILESQR